MSFKMELMMLFSAAIGFWFGWVARAPMMHDKEKRERQERFDEIDRKLKLEFMKEDRQRAAAKEQQTEIEAELRAERIEAKLRREREARAKRRRR